MTLEFEKMLEFEILGQMQMVEFEIFSIQIPAETESSRRTRPCEQPESERFGIMSRD